MTGTSPTGAFLKPATANFMRARPPGRGDERDAVRLIEIHTGLEWQPEEPSETQLARLIETATWAANVELVSGRPFARIIGGRQARLASLLAIQNGQMHSVDHLIPQAELPLNTIWVPPRFRRSVLLRHIQSDCDSSVYVLKLCFLFLASFEH